MQPIFFSAESRLLIRKDGDGYSGIPGFSDIQFREYRTEGEEKSNIILRHRKIV